MSQKTKKKEKVKECCVSTFGCQLKIKREWFRALEKRADPYNCLDLVRYSDILQREQLKERGKWA